MSGLLLELEEAKLEYEKKLQSHSHVKSTMFGLCWNIDELKVLCMMDVI